MKMYNYLNKLKIFVKNAWRKITKETLDKQLKEWVITFGNKNIGK